MVNPNKIAKETMEFMVLQNIPLTPKNYSKFYHAFLYIEEENLEIFSPSEIFELAEKIESQKDLKKIIENLEKKLEETAQDVSLQSDKIKAQKEKIETEKDIEKILTQLTETINITDNLVRYIYQQKQFIERIKKELTEKEQLIYKDELTQFLNRRAFDKDIKELVKNNVLFTIALIDIDNFKKINDTYGHPFGDEVLSEFSKIANNTLRESDKKYRIGGEEFAIIFIKTELPTAYKALERFRENFKNKIFKHNNEKIQITFSAGMVEFKGCNNAIDKCVKELIEKADNLLYKAKNYGKDIIMTG